MRRIIFTIIMAAMVILLTSPPQFIAQDTIRGGQKPTQGEVQNAEEIIRRAKSEPNALMIYGYMFIEIDLAGKMTWHVVEGSTGEVYRYFIPKGVVYEGFLQPKGATKPIWTKVPKSDKDRVMVVGIMAGKATLLRIQNGASPDDDHIITAYSFVIGGGDIPPVVIPPVIVPPVIVPPVIPPVIDPPVTPIVEKLGFTSMAIAEGGKVPAAAKGLASQLADNFEAVQAKLAATATMSIDEAQASLTEKNRATLGANRAAWLPFFQAWAAKADQHNASGAMATPADYVTAYTETASGLRKVK